MPATAPRPALERVREPGRVRLLLDSVFAGSADSMLAITDDYRVAYLNPSAERMLGYNNADSAGRPVADFLFEMTLASGSIEAIAAHRTGTETPVRIESNLFAAAGHTYRLLRLTPIAAEWRAKSVASWQHEMIDRFAAGFGATAVLEALGELAKALFPGTAVSFRDSSARREIEPDQRDFPIRLLDGDRGPVLQIRWRETAPDELPPHDKEWLTSSIKIAALAVEQDRAQKDLQSCNVRHRGQLSRTALVYVETDRTGCIVEWNRAAEKLFGRRRLDVAGKPLRSVLPAAESIHQDLPPMPSHTKHLHLTREGREILCEWYRTPLVDEEGDVLGTSWLGVDVTIHEGLLDAARSESSQLSREMLQRRRRFVNVSGGALEALQSVERLAAILSHSLSGPSLEYAREIHAAASSQIPLLQGMCDLERVATHETGIQRVSFELQEVIEHALEEAEDHTLARGAEVLLWYSPESPRCYLGDARVIRKVVAGLVANALRHNQTRQILVEVSIFPRREGLDEISIAVHEGGALAAVAPAPEYEPLRKLANLLEGDVTVMTSPGHGATVLFQLRLRRQPYQTPFVVGGMESLRGYRILLAGGSEACRFIRTEWCSHWGLRPIDAASPAEALELLNRADADGDPFLLCLQERAGSDAQLEALLHAKAARGDLRLIQPPRSARVARLGAAIAGHVETGSLHEEERQER